MEGACNSSIHFLTTNYALPAERRPNPGFAISTSSSNFVHVSSFFISPQVVFPVISPETKKPQADSIFRPGDFPIYPQDQYITDIPRR